MVTTMLGARPIISLRSNIKLEKQADGTYIIKNKEAIVGESINASNGVLSLDFETRKDSETGINYTRKGGLGCYGSIVGQEDVNNKYDSIYEFLEKEEIDDRIKQIYYIALGRERWGTYKTENISNISTILKNID